MPRTPAEFLQTLDWDLEGGTVEWKWMGQFGVLQWSPNMHARLGLARTIKQGEYKGLSVEIMSHEGRVAYEEFLFDDLLNKADRIDHRPDYPCREGSTTYVIKSNQDYDFYIAKPAETWPLTKTVMEWIELYQD